MAIGDSSVGLLFTIKADDQASGTIKNLAQNASSELDKLEQSTGGGSSGLQKLASSLGISTEAAGGLSSALPFVGTALVGAGAGIAATVGFATTLTAGLFALTKASSDYGSAIFDVTQKTGLGAESISTLKLAADQSGSSLEAISGSVSKFSKLIGSAAEGSKEATESLKRLGLDPVKALSDLDGSLESVFKKIYDAKNPIVATKLATEAFGKSGADLIPVIKQMNGDFAAFKEEAKRLGVVMTDADAAAADEFGDTLTQLDTQLLGVRNTIGNAFMPTFLKMANSFSAFLIDNQSNIKHFSSVAAIMFDDLVSGIAKYLSKIQEYRKEILTFFAVLGKIDPVAGAVFNYAGGVSDRANTQAQAQEDDITANGDKGVFSKKPAGDSGLDTGKAAEQAAKQESAAREKLNSAEKAQIEQQFADLNVLTTQNYKDKLSSSETYRANVLENETAFTQRLKQLTANGFDEQIAQEKNKTAQKALETNKRTALADIESDSQKRRTAANNLIVESEKKATDEIQKSTEKQAQSTIDAAERQIDANKRKTTQNLANLDLEFTQSLISEKDFIGKSDTLKYQSSVYARKLYQELLKDKTLTEDQRIELEKKVADVSAQIDLDLTETTKKNVERRKKEIEAEIQAAQDLLDIKRDLLRAENDLADFRAEQSRKVLVNTVDSSSGNARQKALQVLAQYDADDEDRRSRNAVKELESERVAAVVKVGNAKNALDQIAAIDQEYADREKLVTEQTEAAKKEIRQRYIDELRNSTSQDYGGGLFGGLMGDLATISDPTISAAEKQKMSLESLGGAYDLLKQTAGSALNSMAGASQDLLTQWILTGKGSAKAFAQIAASAVASLVVQAGIQAIFQLAEGYASLAVYDFVGASNHFASAATFGTVAGAAAVAAVGLRLAVGNSFSNQDKATAATTAQNDKSSGGSSSSGRTDGTPGNYYSSAGDTVKNINEDRMSRIENAMANMKGEITVKVESKDSHIINVVKDNVDNRGDLHSLIVKYADN